MLTSHFTRPKVDFRTYIMKKRRLRVSDVYLYSGKRRTASVSTHEEEEERGRFSSSTPNGGVPPRQRGRSSLYPASPSIHGVVHRRHMTPAGITMRFPCSSDWTVFDFHLNPKAWVWSFFLFVCFFGSEIGAASRGCERRLVHALSPDTPRVTIYLNRILCHGRNPNAFVVILFQNSLNRWWRIQTCEYFVILTINPPVVFHSNFNPRKERKFWTWF